jgi:hypothetical protein
VIQIQSPQHPDFFSGQIRERTFLRFQGLWMTVASSTRKILKAIELLSK